jgi:hypothetical protein
MSFLKNKKIAMIFTVCLMLSMSVAPMLIPQAGAHTPPIQIPTLAYINVGPNPVGVGQQVNVGFWLNQPPPDAVGPFGDRWMGMTVKVTSPNGTVTTLGPFTSDDTGGTHTNFVPSQTGTYSFQMFYPGQVLAGNNPSPALTSVAAAFINDTYMASNSVIATLTVQSAPVGGLSGAPLPTNYWTTPINALNVNNWYVLGGASLFTNGYSTSGGGQYNVSSNYNPYTTAPMSAHILWTKPEAFGGVLGGQYGGTTTYGNYYSTSQYEKKFDQIVINGYLYYTQFPGSSTTPVANLCVDLYNGQVVWSDDSTNYGGGSPAQTALTATGLVTPFIYGQVLDFVAPNQYGGLAYLWTTGTPAGIVSSGTTFNMFDAMTGRYILSIVNGTGMTMTFDSSGDLVGYYLNNTAGTQMIDGPISSATGPARVVSTINGPSLNEWNSTQCIMAGAWAASASGWEWRPPQNGLIDFSLGLMWRTPAVTNISGVPIPAYTTSPGGIRCINSGVIVLAAFAPGGASYFQAGFGCYSGYDINTGQLLWSENITMYPYTENGNTGSGSVGDGVWTIPSHQNGEIQGYSLTTGQLPWTDNLTPFDAYDSVGGYFANLAGNTLYLAGFGGDIWSINMLNGTVNWYTNTTMLMGSSAYNSPYGVWPLWGFSQGGIAGGLLFVEEGHEYSPPLFLGAQQLAINTTNGKLVWSVDAFDVDSHPVTAYGVMTSLNAYDNQIYAYGQGPTATTISAPQVGISTATPITITGTVMDISAGAKQDAVAGNFPNGLPAISDASMSQFMEAVYMQQQMPSNITGVPVTLSVLDSNGNNRVIGTTTTNSLGTYSYTWTPDVSGNYTVYATFAGSNSYYPSSASTGFYASTPAQTVAPAPLASTQPTGMYIALAAVAIIIVVAIVGVVLFIAIRKRP